MIIEFFEQDAENVVNNRITIRFSDRINGKYYDYLKSVHRSILKNIPELQRQVLSMSRGILKSRRMIYRLKKNIHE